MEILAIDERLYINFERIQECDGSILYEDSSFENMENEKIYYIVLIDSLNKTTNEIYMTNHWNSLDDFEEYCYDISSQVYNAQEFADWAQNDGVLLANILYNDVYSPERFDIL